MGIDDYIIEHTNFDRILKSRTEIPTYNYALIKSGQPDNHAPSIFVDNQRIAYIVWFAGSEEGCGDVSIYLSVLRPGNDRWSEARQISSFPGYSCQNPLIIGGRCDDELVIYHTIHPGKKSSEPYTQEKALIIKITSNDQGETWSLPEIVYRPAGFFIRSNPIMIDSALILFPVYYCPFQVKDQCSGVLAFTGHQKPIFYPIPESNFLGQPCLIKLNNSHYQIYLRDRNNKWIYRSESPDGLCWNAPKPTSLKNNDSGFAFLALDSRRILGVINPDRETRCPLTVVISQDQGESWQHCFNLDPYFEIPKDLLFPGYLPELSYPSIWLDATKNLHVVYTYCHGGIKYIRLAKEQIEALFDLTGTN